MVPHVADADEDVVRVEQHFALVGQQLVAAAHRHRLVAADRFWEFGRAELDDTRLLVEKIAALGGEPTTEVAEMRWSGDAGDAVDWIIETEEEAVETLQAAIEPTGREGRSEALEHMLEHMIMRKQNQVDFLVRARRSS